METLKATLMVNGQGIVLKNVDPDCFLGQLCANETLTDHIHINDRIVLLSFLADLREKSSAMPVSVRLNCPDRTRFVPVILSCEAAFNECYYLNIAANSDDIKDDKVNHVAPLARVAHEMRTPLNAILGFADLLDYVDQQTEKEQKRREYIAMIKQAGKHLLDVVDNTLKSHSEVDADEKQASCVIGDIIKETVAVTAPLRGARVIRVKTALEPINCAIDAISCRQICFNILSNAIKYSRDNGHITISLSLLSERFCQLTIVDDGIGMEASHLAQLGLPFLRAPEVVANKIEGVGLGLALVFDLVKRVGGQIAFDSHKGKGTRVKIVLPLTEPTSFRNNGYQDSGCRNDYDLTPEIQCRNNGKKTKNKQNPNRKTA